MTDIAEKVAYVDRTLEAAEAVLNNPVVVERLGERVDTLSTYLGRIVPILSSEDAERRPEVLTPDAIPLLVISPNEVISFGAGVDQFSTAQKQAAWEAVDGWEPRDYTPTYILGALLSARNVHRVGSPQDTSHTFREGVKAALYSEDTIVTGDEFREKLTLTNGPDGKIVRLSYRPLLVSYVSKQQLSANPEVLLHELTHVGQNESMPIIPYSSQREVDELALRGELEAYHVGATVIATLSGKDILEMETSGENRDAQILVEQARLISLALDPSDPFKPNKWILRVLEDDGLGIDTLVHDRVDFEKVLESMGMAPNSARKPSKNKRYTPPKNKR